MKKTFLLMLTCTLMSGQAFAQMRTLECNVDDRRRTAWIPDRLVIQHNIETADVLISGPIIFAFNDRRPIPGRVATDNKKRTTYTWTLKGVRNSQGQYAPNFTFRGTYLKTSKKFTITSRPGGYEDVFKGKGRCALRKG